MVLEQAQFAHRPDYLSLPADTKLTASDVQLFSQVMRSEGEKTNAVVRLTAQSAKGALYSFEVSYSALFAIDTEGEEVQDMDRRLMVTGSTMLYPFVREVVANLTAKGRFGPTWLAPVNFNNTVAQKTEEPAKTA